MDRANFKRCPKCGTSHGIVYCPKCHPTTTEKVTMTADEVEEITKVSVEVIRTAQQLSEIYPLNRQSAISFRTDALKRLRAAIELTPG